MKSRSGEYDVIVVGAGPGGASAAYYTALAGCRVLLVDRDEFPRDKVCGDGLVQRSVCALEEMGFTRDELTHAGAVTIEGTRVFQEGILAKEFHFESTPGLPGQALALPRLKLDALLRQRALAVGAHWRGGFNVYAVRPANGEEMPAVFGQTGQGGEVIRAPIVIVAAGAQAPFYRDLDRTRDRDEQPGLPVRPLAAGLRQYYSCEKGATSTFDFFYERYLPDGYAWVFPVGPHLFNVGVWTAAKAEQRHPREAFSRFVAETGPAGRLPAGARPLGPAKGAIMRPSPRTALASGGLLWIGEAAGLLHRASGQGISYALDSGCLAAATAVDAIFSGDFRDEALSLYTRKARALLSLPF